MSLEYEAFDQTLQEGWRAYHEDIELQILLLEDYIARNDAKEQSLRWHLGQAYGMANNYEKAIQQFETCIFQKPGDNVYRSAWNYYVKGTVAFMKRDRERLKLYVDSLENNPETMNVEVLRRLDENFNKPYSEAY